MSVFKLGAPRKISHAEARLVRALVLAGARHQWVTMEDAKLPRTPRTYWLLSGLIRRGLLVAYNGSMTFRSSLRVA